MLYHWAWGLGFYSSRGLRIFCSTLVTRRKDIFLNILFCSMDIYFRASHWKSPGCVTSFWMLICFALFRSVISLQVSRHPFNQSVAPLKLSTSGSVTSFCSRRRILTMASWGEHTVKVFLANGFWSSLIKMLFGLYCRMEWLQQGSRELFGTIIEDQVCAGFSLKHNLWS